MSHYARSAWQLVSRFRLHAWSQFIPDTHELPDPVTTTATCLWCGKTKTVPYWDHAARGDR